jgi:hypothetical protein
LVSDGFLITTALDSAAAPIALLQNSNPAAKK